MASEPNNNAEDQLKRYASERRQQPAPELHPATRRMLQGEVARVYGTPRSEGRAGWRRWLLAPGFAWALGLAFVAGLTLFIVRESGPARRKEDVAQPAITTSPTLPKPSAEPGAGVPSGPPGVSENKSTESLQKNETVSLPATPTPPKLEAADKAAVKESAESRERQLSLNEKDTVRLKREAANKPQASLKTAPSPLAAAPPAAVPQTAPTGSASAAQGALRDESDAGVLLSNRADQRALAQAATASAQAARRVPSNQMMMGGGPAPAQVLNRFYMRQVGQTVSFEDSDKSVYAGAVTAQQAGTNLFRAYGTNLTLKQPVTITGQISRAQMPSQNQTQLRQNVQQQQALGGRQNFGANDDYGYRVQGQATVGSNTQVLIDAASAAAAP